MEGDVPIFAECYANKWFSKKLKESLENVRKKNFEIKHTPEWGRDRILSNVLKYMKKWRIKTAILVIDLEETVVARRYVENFFSKLTTVKSEYNFKGAEKILFGIRIHKKQKILGIVFDSKIEDFLCKFEEFKKRFTNKSFKQTIKSKEAERVLEKLFQSNRELENCIKSLSKILLINILK